MATLTATPASAPEGTPIAITGDGFTPGAVVTISIPSFGFMSEVVADAAGFIGTDDIADHATALLTSTGTIPTANDTVTLGAVTYTFKASVTTTANEVALGASAAAALANLKKAVNLTGVGGTDYGSATVIHPTVGALTLTATTLLFYAKTGGTGGNSLASTEASTQLSFGGATFSGGSAASGVSAVLFSPDEEGTYSITATDGTNSAATSVSIWTVS